MLSSEDDVVGGRVSGDELSNVVFCQSEAGKGEERAVGNGVNHIPRLQSKLHISCYYSNRTYYRSDVLRYCISQVLRSNKIFCLNDQCQHQRKNGVFGHQIISFTGNKVGWFPSIHFGTASQTSKILPQSSAVICEGVYLDFAVGVEFTDGRFTAELRTCDNCVRWCC